MKPFQASDMENYDFEFLLSAALPIRQRSRIPSYLIKYLRYERDIFKYPYSTYALSQMQPSETVNSDFGFSLKIEALKIEHNRTRSILDETS